MRLFQEDQRGSNKSTDIQLRETLISRRLGMVVKGNEKYSNKTLSPLNLMESQFANINNPL